MPEEMNLKLTLQNTGTEPLHLTSLAPQTGWKSAPPHHLAANNQIDCEIVAADELTITLRYGVHHIGLHFGNGKLHVEPGDSKLIRQKLDGHNAELTLAIT